jgi:hypothetical protein
MLGIKNYYLSRVREFSCNRTSYHMTKGAERPGHDWQNSIYKMPCSIFSSGSLIKSSIAWQETSRLKGACKYLVNSGDYIRRNVL